MKAVGRQNYLLFAFRKRSGIAFEAVIPAFLLVSLECVLLIFNSCCYVVSYGVTPEGDCCVADVDASGVEIKLGFFNSPKMFLSNKSRYIFS